MATTIITLVTKSITSDTLYAASKQVSVTSENIQFEGFNVQNSLSSPSKGIQEDVMFITTLPVANVITPKADWQQ